MVTPNSITSAKQSKAVRRKRQGNNSALRIAELDSTSVTSNEDVEDEGIDYLEEIHNYAIPPNCICSRFVLPVSLYRVLREHPLCRELFPTSAGFCKKDRRRQEHPSLRYSILYYFTGGEMKVHTEGNIYPVRPGDLIVIPSGTPFITEGSQTAPGEFFYVVFAGLQMDAYTQFLNVSNRVAHVGLNPRLVTKFEQLCDLRTSDFLLDTFVNGANHLKSLLTSFSLVVSKGMQEKNGRIDLEAIRRLMASRMDGSLTLNELAQSANTSPFHFVRLFKKIAGMPPMHYYIQERIQNACHQLDTTRDPISKIAATVGYDDPQYFSRIFRQVVGMTPQAYRKAR